MDRRGHCTACGTAGDTALSTGDTALRGTAGDTALHTDIVTTSEAAQPRSTPLYYLRAAATPGRSQG